MVAAASIAPLLALALAAHVHFEVAPAPAWVEPVPVDASLTAPDEARSGVDYILMDDQVRVVGASHERYRHLAHRVLSAEGVANGSEIRIDFDPEYRRLVVHGVWLQRGGRRIAALRPGDVKVLQRETDLDRRQYDGTLTAVIFVSDVRVGDVVEYAFTLRGANSVFGGRYAGGFDLAYRTPVGRIRARLLWPEGRPMFTKLHGLHLSPRVVRRGGVAEHVWERTTVPAVAAESDLPSGFDPYPWVEVTDWPSLNAVARWAAALYPDAPPGPALARQIETWRRLPTEEARAQAALRFVQDEVRYLGIEMGPNSHRPHAPDEVFARRFGDCKDKSFLLVRALRALGIEAAPALVNTSIRDAVEDRAPTPLAFDHVIVAARISGAERWLEPTRSLEHGAIGALVPPPYRRALLVQPDAVAFTAIPEPPAPELDVENAYRIERFGAPVRMHVTTRLTGTRAIAMRHQLASEPLSDVQKSYLDFYAHEEPKIRVSEPIRVRDAPDADVLTVEEWYELPSVADGADHDFFATAIEGSLKDPATPIRKMPLGLAHPVRIREVTRVELPGTPHLAPGDDTVDDGVARLSRQVRVEGSAIAIEWSYATQRDRVDVDRVPAHLASLKKMRKIASVAVPLAVEAARPARGEGGALGWLVGAIVGIGFVAAVVLRAAEGGLRQDLRNGRLWYRRKAFASKFRMARGESPQVPIAIRGATETARHVARRRCGCGAPLHPEPASLGTVRYGGGEVSVATHQCTACGAPVSLYFVLV